MRITGGALRGRKLKAPRGRATRPTADMVRKAIFDVLGPSRAMGRVLDLFAGTGALGLEALSRGAQEVVFVERRRDALQALRENVEALGVKEHVRVLPLDVKKALKVLRDEGASFDLVLLDPPYLRGMAEEALRQIADSGILAQGAVVVLEHSSREAPQPPSGLDLFSRHRYGDTTVSFFSCVA